MFNLLNYTKHITIKDSEFMLLAQKAVRNNGRMALKKENYPGQMFLILVAVKAKYLMCMVFLNIHLTFSSIPKEK